VQCGACGRGKEEAEGQPSTSEPSADVTTSDDDALVERITRAVLRELGKAGT